ncbi:M1 family aminopeptidase [Candidatus Kapabacteria bacterium]|nr:M1 family aminopeptidase [Candidatus Kapabacteria bacterium]
MSKIIILITILSLNLFSEIPEFLKHQNPHQLDYDDYLSKSHGLGCVGKFHYKLEASSLLEEFNPIVKRNYDITNIDLFLDWSETLDYELSNSAWNGKVEIIFDLLEENSEKIEFDALELRLDKAILNGVDITDEVNTENGLYSINDMELVNQESNTISFEYTYQGATGDGFYRFLLESNNEDIAYTQSQPNDARRWFPCNDNPYEKQLTTIAIKVPENDRFGKGFITASNGQLVDSLTTSSTIGGQEKISKTYYWNHDYQVPSYLMVANASAFVRWEEKVARIENQADSVLLSYYIWEEDLDGYNNNSPNYDVKEQTFNVIPNMVDTLSKYFGPYPFKKFGTVAVENFPAGGMEHQSIQTIRRSWINGAVGGFSHELAHMWLGDKVTCESWNDIWMNEGGAVFGTILYTEKAWGDTWKNLEKSASKNNYINSGGLSLTPLYISDGTNVFSQSRIPVIYSKAGWVYLMLRNLIGEEDFYDILQDYFEEFSYSSANTVDFTNFFKSKTDKDIDTFMKQWVYGSGHPVYDIYITLRDEGNPNKAKIELEQIQGDLSPRDDCEELFEVPLRILIDYEDGTDSVVVFNDEKIFSIEIEKEKEILGLRLDENFTLFNSYFTEILSINQNTNESFKVYPSLIKNNEKLQVESNQVFKSIMVFDQLGRIVLELENMNSNKVKFPINLNSGKYFLKAFSSDKIFNSSFIVN